MSHQEDANAENPELTTYQVEEPVIDEEDEANLAALDEEFGEDHDADEIEALDEEAEKEMDELEKLMESTATPSKGVVPAGAVPTEQSGRLSSHAAEFWFPECRECACCRGYKHGCDCVKKEKFIACQAATCNIDPAHKDQKLTEDTMPQQRGDNNSGRRSTSDNASNMCRFEQSPGGCRFGASCRFRHVGGGGGSGHDNQGSYGRKQGQRGGGHSGYNNQYGNSNRSYSDPNQVQYGYPADPQYQYSNYQAYPPQAPYPSQGVSPTYHQGRSAQPSSPTGRDQICQYFQNGSCMYGANCRFKHV